MRLFALLVVLVLFGCAGNPPLPPDPRYPMEYTANSLWAKPPKHKESTPTLKPAGEVRERQLTIFLDSQIFQYVEDGQLVLQGPVSSGSPEHPTPTGSFKVLSKNKDKRSSSYTNYFDQNTPMPYSLQFLGPYYIHEGYLPGHAASHGCVRLKYEDAKLLFQRTRVGDAVIVSN